MLIVLPQEEEEVRIAWKLVKAIDAPRGRVMPVSLHGRVPYVPDAFAGAVFQVEESKLDWRGLPKKVVSDAVWTRRPNVAIDLSSSFDLAAAYLVGASSAALRVALHNPQAEPFFDLLIAPTHGYRVAVGALRHYLAALEPPALAFSD